MIWLHWWNKSAVGLCACVCLCNFIEVLGTAYHGGEMIDISDGNSILHQHRVVNLLALLKKAWIMFYWCSVELLLSDVMHYCCSFFQNCKDFYCLQSELCFHILPYCFPNCLATSLHKEKKQGTFSFMLYISSISGTTVTSACLTPRTLLVHYVNPGVL